jgi:hypothetical protein
LRRVDLREEVCALEAAGTHTGPGHDGLLQWAHNPGRLNGVYAVKGAEGGRKGCSFEQADIDALNLAGISKLCGFSAECKNMKHWHYMKKNNNAIKDVYEHCQTHGNGPLAGRLFQVTPAVRDAAAEIGISVNDASVVAMLAGYAEPHGDIRDRIWEVIDSFYGYLPFGLDEDNNPKLRCACGKKVFMKRPSRHSGAKGDRTYTVHQSCKNPDSSCPDKNKLRVKICFTEDGGDDDITNFYLACFSHCDEGAPLGGKFVRVEWDTKLLGVPLVGD